MKVLATILAVERRRQFAERLKAEVAEHIPVEMSINDITHSTRDAFRRFKELLQFATLQNAEWLLFLEDDQEIYPALWENLDELLTLADEHDVANYYLSNRETQIGQLGWLGKFRVNRLMTEAAGSHGLLIRGSLIPKILKTERLMPIDFAVYRALQPQQYKHYQILRPVLIRHIGSESTLYRYRDQNHLFTHPVNI